MYLVRLRHGLGSEVLSKTVGNILTKHYVYYEQRAFVPVDYERPHAYDAPSTV